MRLGLILFILPVIAIGAGVSVAKPRPNQPTTITKPWLGVSIKDGRGGVLITEVIPNTPAEISGLKVGDLVYAISGVSTPRAQYLISHVKTYSVGDVVEVSLRRRVASKSVDLSFSLTLSGWLNKQELFRRRLMERVAPNFDLTVLHGSTSGRLSRLRGKVVILQFWSPNCLSCLAKFSELAALEATSQGGLVILGISQGPTSSVKRFLDQNSVGITLLDDSGGGVRRSYGLEGVELDTEPAAIVIGRDGVVRHADVGQNLRWDDVFLTARLALREEISLD